MHANEYRPLDRPHEGPPPLFPLQRVAQAGALTEMHFQDAVLCKGVVRRPKEGGGPVVSAVVVGGEIVWIDRVHYDHVVRLDRIR